MLVHDYMRREDLSECIVRIFHGVAGKRGMCRDIRATATPLRSIINNR